MSLLHVEGRHEADGELAVLGLAGPRDLRRIEIRRIVFLPNRETKSNVSQSSNSDNNNNKNTLYVHKQMAIGIAVMCVCACWDRFAFVFLQPFLDVGLAVGRWSFLFCFSLARRCRRSQNQVRQHRNGGWRRNKKGTKKTQKSSRAEQNDTENQLGCTVFSSIVSICLSV